MKAQFGSLPAERHWVRGVVSRGGNLSIGTCALSMVAGVTGLEPATSGVTGMRQIAGSQALSNIPAFDRSRRNPRVPR